MANQGLERSVAVMQPYFYPYLPYFALIAAVDTFVIYDCVQFPRRGRVHRTELGIGSHGPHWLTLPLRPKPREVRIQDLELAPDAAAEMRRRCKEAETRLDFSRLPGKVREHLYEAEGDVVSFLEQGLRAVADLLGLSTRFVRSSAYEVDPSVRGAERVAVIARLAGGTRYVNASGGRTLYDAAFFASRGLELQFLRPYDGPHRYMLPSLARADLQDLQSEVRRIAAERDAADG